MKREIYWLPHSGKRIEIISPTRALLHHGRDWTKTLRVEGEEKVSNLIAQAKENGWKRRIKIA